VRPRAELCDAYERFLSIVQEATMKSHRQYLVEVSGLCLDCFRITRKTSISFALRGTSFDRDGALLDCSELCRRAAFALTAGRTSGIGLLSECALGCSTCADLCEAMDQDACAIACWEAAAALGDEIARRTPVALMAAE
jgi:hypothetical protein